MMIAVAFLISWVMGWSLCTLLLKKSPPDLFMAKLFLSIGLGLGCSAHLVFLTFLLVGQFDAVVLFRIHMIVLFVILLFLHRESKRDLPKAPGGQASLARRHPYDLFVLAGLVFLFHIVGTLAGRLRPYGEWDAWAVWNMKAKFLMASGPFWANIFQLHWHTQPDYPLLLPFINAWGWSMSPAGNIPLVTAAVFTVGCGGLLYAGLIPYAGRAIASLASCLLMSLPPFLLIGTAQYADIVLAYYLLAAMIAVQAAVRNGDPRAALLAGVNWGFLSFVKNEGAVMAILLGVLSLSFVWRQRKEGRAALIGALLLGLAITSIPTLIFKIYLSPPNRDIFLSPFFSEAKFFNLGGIYLIVRHFMVSLLDPDFFFLWPLLLAMFFLAFRRYFQPPANIMTWFFLFYILVVILVYLTTVNFDLQWRLMRTLPRILITLLPSLLFWHFSVWGPSTPKQNRHS